MITIETVVDILKKDNNFREIIEEPIHHSYTNKSIIFKKISYDSRQVDDKTLFFVKGSNFKKEFLMEAVASGLRYYISEQDFEIGVPVILVNNVRQAMSLIATDFYGYPQKKLKLLAFTGTKGKTTAVYFAYNILRENFKPAMVSTIATTLDGKTFSKSTLTTPESIDLFSMMATAVNNGMSHFIMEVSSQAYLLKRVYKLLFDVGVFLNISPDHIGPIEHPSFEDYFYHKRLLLENSRVVIINSQINHIAMIKEQIQNKTVDFYGSDSQNKITASNRCNFSLNGKLKGHYNIKLVGKFNQENAIAAGLACLRLGATPSDVRKGISKTKVPGHMEILVQKNNSKVFIDYAHNGVSLHKLIKVVKHYHKGRIILVIGATGNKGENRRKDFAKVINNYPSIKVILTSDDPNFEDPENISKEIVSYIKRSIITQIETDRRKAIHLALSEATEKDDAVIIAGKGPDAYQIIKGEKCPYEGDLKITKAYIKQAD